MKDFKHIFNQLDKDILPGFVIAVFVSCLFYWLHNKPGMIRTMLDVRYMFFGICLPYVLPLYIVFKNKKMEMIKKW